MKKASITRIALCLLTSLILSNCTTETKKNQAPELPNTTENRYKDTVSLTTAVMNIQNYVSNCDKYLNDTIPIRSYTINRADLFGILGVTSVPGSQYDRCRVYIGLDSLNKFKLYMTPTVLLPTSKGSRDSVYVDKILYDSVHGNHFVYDLNAPCPSTCDKTSVLYTLKIKSK